MALPPILTKRSVTEVKVGAFEKKYRRPSSNLSSMYLDSQARYAASTSLRVLMKYESAEIGRKPGNESFRPGHVTQEFDLELSVDNGKR